MRLVVQLDFSVIIVNLIKSRPLNVVIWGNYGECEIRVVWDVMSCTVTDENNRDLDNTGRDFFISGQML